jgi:hypothetical protein
MATHSFIISPSAAGLFDGQVNDQVTCSASATPFYDSAAALLASGIAHPTDTLVMRLNIRLLADMQHELLRATIAQAARLKEKRAGPAIATYFRAAPWS